MNASLFSEPVYQPLAARLRPKQLDDYVGQEHILAQGKPLREALETGIPHSMVLWGPPGVGKTTLARLIAEVTEANFEMISAVLSGVKEIRQAVDRAQEDKRQGRRTILFVDEVHRFNKSQQDAFLPFVEDGTFVFIGATTENPSFELNSALLSRARVYILKSLDNDVLEGLLLRALKDQKVGLGALNLAVDSEALSIIAHASDGDARRALNILEITADLVSDDGKITADLVQEVIQNDTRRFDKGGDIFYEQISALHKSVRGSSPDGALYWFCRMIDGGCDPLYIARRVVRMASEEIGNADPRALTLALSAWETQQRLGSPEGELALAQAITYLAAAPKSNAVYTAFNKTMKLVKESQSHEVPVHLRNAPTKLMKNVGYGAEYRYAHDENEAYAAGESYLPEELSDQVLYEPVPRGLEIKIKDKLSYLKSLDQKSNHKRYGNQGNG